MTSVMLLKHFIYVANISLTNGGVKAHSHICCCRKQYFYTGLVKFFTTFRRNHRQGLGGYMKRRNLQGKGVNIGLEFFTRRRLLAHAAASAIGLVAVPAFGTANP